MSHDYGITNVECIDSEQDFWCIFDELVDDNSEFLQNRNTILDSWRKGNMFGVRIVETESMYQRGARGDTLFCADSWYLVPCFCIKDENTVIIIWTHSRARRMGFAKKMIESLEIKNTLNPLPESYAFWEACGLKN